MALEIRRDGPVEHLVLNRPDVRNAFNETVIADLTRWAQGVEADSSVRVAVLSGAGKVFCAGADLEWMSRAVGYAREENLRDAAALASMFEALNTLRVPLVGRVHGAALGGGAGLVAVCDIVVAAETARFGFTEVKLGILPAAISPYALAKIGVSAARELFLTGARFSAARAQAIGLVHEIVPEADLDRALDGHVRELLTSCPSGVAAAKALIPRIAARPPADVLPITSAAIADQRVSADGQEGMRAFLDKRKPRWVE